MSNGIIIVLIISYIISRGFIELFVITYFSKNTYKSYKKQTNFLQRYWLIWIAKNSCVKYLKSERRYINYPIVMAVLFYTNIILFLSLIIVFLLVFLGNIDVLDMKYSELGILIYIVEIIISFGIYAFLENYVHNEYHRKRRRR